MKSRRGKLMSYLGLSIQGDLGGITTYTNHRGKVVMFPRASPLNPPSPAQEAQRDVYRRIAAAWRDYTPQQRQAWLTCARRAGLIIGGYQLLTWFAVSRNEPALRTLERQTGITLRRPEL